jgi:hypothetical protein
MPQRVKEKFSRVHFFLLPWQGGRGTREGGGEGGRGGGGGSKGWLKLVLQV